MLEKEIEAVLVREVGKMGGVAYKFVSPGRVGVPDRIVILPGRRPVFVELKTDHGELTATQSVQIRKLRDLGQTVEITYGLDGVKDLLKRLRA